MSYKTIAQLPEITDSSLTGEELLIVSDPSTSKSIKINTLLTLSNLQTTPITGVDGGTAGESYDPESIAVNQLSSGTTTGYNAGYTYAYTSNSSFSINGLDVTSLFYSGRKVSFTDGGSTYTGTVTTSTFGTDTLVNVSMDGGDVLTNTITDVVFISDVSSWVPIASDPFNGTTINAITSGLIAGTVYWVAVGDSGKAFSSSDKGITWVDMVSGITDHLHSVAYNLTSNSFMIVGDNKAVLLSTDGTSLTLLTTDLPGNSQTMTQVIWYRDSSLWATVHTNGNGNYIVYTSPDGLAWIGRTPLGTTPTTKIYEVIQSNGTYDLYLSAGNTVSKYDTPTSTSSTDAWVVPSGSVADLYKYNTNDTTAAHDAIYIINDGIIGRVVEQHFDNQSGNTNIVAPNITNAMAYSSLGRLIIVGDNGLILSVESVDFDSSFQYTAIANGFNPTTRILDVHWNTTDAIFIAVAENGQIARSTSGII